MMKQNLKWMLTGWIAVVVLLAGCSAPTKPTIRLTPISGQINAGQEITFQVTANDGQGISHVEIAADNILIDDADINPPQRSVTVPFKWIAVAGQHQIAARAYATSNMVSDLDTLMVSVTGGPTPVPTAARTATAVLPTPVPGPSGCTNNAAFVTDVTVPDGTPFMPNQTFNKIWRVQNAGSCTWNNKYQLVFANGERMASVTQIGVTANVAPGQTYDLLVAMTTPAGVGSHAGQWQLRDEAGATFGPTLIAKVTTLSPIAPPQASIASPGNGFRASPGDTVRVTFQGTSATELASITLFVNGTQVAKQTSRTPTRSITGNFDWKPAAGNYDLYAVAADIQGQQGVSAHIAGVVAGGSCQAAISLRADRTTMNAGEHTNLRWDVECVKAIYLDNQGVGGHETRDVAPSRTTTYTLRVVKNDNSSESRTVTITINGSPQPTAVPQPTAAPQPVHRDINGTWSSGEYSVELSSADGCGTNCGISGSYVHMTAGAPEVGDVSGSFNTSTGAVSWSVSIPGGPSFSGTVSSDSRTMSGTLSGVGGISFSK